MSLLTLIQRFCRRTQLPSPTTVMGSTSDQVLQLRDLLEEEGTDLAQRGPWQALVQEATFTSLATIDQGAISSIASNGFDYLRDQTFWDRTNRWPILGPINGAEWQAVRAWTVTGPRSQYRIFNGRLYLYPAPSAGLSLAFEYVTTHWILDSDGTTYKAIFNADDDVPLLSDRLLLQGLRWRWKKEKGLDYEEDFRTYELQVANALSRDRSNPVLHLDEHTHRRPSPGIFIPQGQWSL